MNAQRSSYVTCFPFRDTATSLKTYVRHICSKTQPYAASRCKFSPVLYTWCSGVMASCRISKVKTGCKRAHTRLRLLLGNTNTHKGKFNHSFIHWFYSDSQSIPLHAFIIASDQGKAFQRHCFVVAGFAPSSASIDIVPINTHGDLKLVTPYAFVSTGEAQSRKSQ